MTNRTLALFLVVCCSWSCDTEKADAECVLGEGPSTLVIDNRSGGLVSTITATPCDGGESHVLPLPEAGVAFAEQATVDLPGPGCWLLTWTGEECRNDPPHRTEPEVCPDEAYEWTITTEGRICDPGGW